MRFRVLIPLDGTDSDTSAAQVAAELVPRNAELFLLHVRSGPDEDRYPALAEALSEAERFERRIESERIFARANAILASHGLSSAVQAQAQGKPVKVIFRYANRMGAGLVVLAANVARCVIDHATCPVLVAGTDTTL